MSLDVSAYVSPGAVKLAAALDAFGLSPDGLICVDIGCGIGGFTELLLERGAAKVYAVDGDRERLHPRLRAEPRVIWRPQANARRLTARHVPEVLGAVLCDTAPASPRLTLPPALRLAGDDAWAVALIRPELELPRDRLDTEGHAVDAAAEADAISGVADFLASACGWRVTNTLESPIRGYSGGREFFIALRRDT